MNDRHQDTDLRARFEAQRRTEADQAPSFASVMARAQAEADTAPVTAPRRLNVRRLVYASGLAAAAVIGALLMIPPSSNEDAFEEAVRAYHNNSATSAWQSPTDGLLNVPGSQLMSTVPSVGVN